MTGRTGRALARANFAAAMLVLAGAAHAACDGGLRKISIGVSVSPPNVVLSTPFVA